MTPAGRLAAAIDLLAAIETETRPADAVANEFFRTRRFIGAADRREVSDLVWGVLRSRRRVGWWLERVGATATPRLLLAARAGLGGGSPQQVSAAFIAGRYGPPPLSEAEAAVLARLAGHTLEHPAMPPAVRFEVPDWIYPRLASRFGATLAPELHALMLPAPLDLRVNSLKTTREAALAALAEEGFAAEPTPLSPWGLRLASRQSVTGSKLFQSGAIEIQDEGSQLIALAVAAEPGMRVADYCAGAAGKTLAIAAMMDNRGSISDCDVSEPRLEAAVKRLRRAGVHNVQRHHLQPGDKWLKRQERKFDRVLVDAPCTGTGTWRRNPDARLRLKESDLAEIMPKQAMILDQAQRLVKPGGRLIYATCSVLPEENEAQVEDFLKRTPDFHELPLGPPLPEALRGAALRLTPRSHGTDGFYACILEKSA